MEESGDASSPSFIPEQLLSKPFQRGAWSSSPQEQAAWIHALRSLATKHGEARRIRYRSEPSEHAPSKITMEGTEIPKIIHFIWLGPNPIPRFPFLPDGDELREHECASHGKPWNECMSSWKRRHAPSEGWRIRVWTDRDVVSVDGDGGTRENDLDASRIRMSRMFNSRGFKYAMSIHHYGMAADILRLEVLNQFGGIYVDVDYWCVGCLDRMVGNSEVENPSSMILPLQFFCGESNTGCLELNNGLMACRKQGHPILWEMMRSIQTYCDGLMMSGLNTLRQVDSFHALLSPYLDVGTLHSLQESRCEEVTTRPSAMNVIEYTGPGLLTRTVCRWLCDDDRDRNVDNPGVEKDESADFGVQTSCCDKRFDTSQVMVLQRDVFHPFPNHLRRDYTSRVREFIIPEVTVAVHLWGCSWQGEGSE
ncbi:hypothetical protein ACHAW6_013610 [Cyclotella cf. meneghiniana]